MSVTGVNYHAEVAYLINLSKLKTGAMSLRCFELDLFQYLAKFMFRKWRKVNSGEKTDRKPYLAFLQVCRKDDSYKMKPLS